MLIIVNPYATTVSDRLKNLVVHALQSRYEVTAFDTQRQGHATELVREAVDEGYDVVVAFGGDGTLNEAANGLAGTDVPLTHLPGGSTNVVCKMLGVPGEIVDATEHLLRMADAWEPRKIDLGRAAGRYFVASAGYGLDAAVTRAVDLKPAAQAPLRRVVLHLGRGADVLPPLPGPPAARRHRDRRRRAARGHRRDPPERRPVHVLQRPPAARGRELVAGERPPRGRDAPPRDADRRAHGRLPPVLQAPPPRRPPADHGLQRRRRRSARGRSTAARSRSSSTATGSGTSATSSSPCTRGR